MDIFKQTVLKGGQGSGNFGHSGREGLVGGSGSNENNNNFSNIDERLVNYKPNRSLSDPTKTVSIQEYIPSAKFVSYGKTPFFEKLTEMQGVGVDSSIEDFVKARQELFDRQPITEIPLDKIIVTQKVVNKERVDEIIKDPSLAGNNPPMLVRYKDETYVINGHHRIISEVQKGAKTIKGRVLNFDDMKFYKGGEGSGNFNHAGRQGYVGGSSSEGGGQSVSSAFTTGRIKDSEKLSKGKTSNTVYKVSIKDDGKGYWKGTQASQFIKDKWWARDMGDLDKCNQASREVMAYQLDKIAGANLIPETTFKDRDNELGSCQQEVEEFRSGMSVPFNTNITNRFKEIDTSQYIKGIIFDDMIGSTDRHTGNFGIDKKNNLKFIDNGLILSSNPNKAWNGNFMKAGSGFLNKVVGFDKLESSYKIMEKTRKQIADKFIDNEDKINTMFSKYHLSVKEKNAFWKRVKE